MDLHFNVGNAFMMHPNGPKCNFVKSCDTFVFFAFGWLLCLNGVQGTVALIEWCARDGCREHHLSGAKVQMPVGDILHI